MQLNLAPDTTAWLDTQVQKGRFSSVEQAIDACVALASLRDSLSEAIADPRRLSVDDVQSNLDAHFEARRAKTPVA